MTIKSVTSVVESLRKTYLSGKTKPLEWRIGQLQALQKGLQENVPAIVEALEKDLGRPADFSQGEVMGVVGQCQQMISSMEEWSKSEPKTVIDTPPFNGAAYRVIKEPLGVVLVFGPWNVPVSCTLEPVVGAIAAGNAVIIKPSEVSEHTGKVIAHIVNSVMDPEAVVCMEGGVQMSTELLEAKMDKIFYTGGGSVARIILAAAAKHLTPVALELGGKCPVWVDESADMAKTAAMLIEWKSLNCGQICLAPDYLLCAQETLPRLLDALKEALKTAPELSTKGHIINKRHWDRISGIINEDHGGDVAVGGMEKADAESLHIPLQVVVNPRLDCKMMQEEIFGPVMPIITIEGMNKALGFVNERETPLAAYIFGQDEQRQKEWSEQVEAGGVCVNNILMHIAHPEVPFGGKGESGMGSYKGKASFDCFTHEKTVAVFH